MAENNGLMREIHAAAVPRGTYAMWWLGQQSWIVKTSSTLIGVDLFLSPHPKRRYRPLLEPGELSRFDLFLGTHDHKDHIDRAAWPLFAAASPGARFILPARVVAEVRAATGLPDGVLVPLDDGRRHSVGDIVVTAVPSAHEWIDNDPAAGGNRWLGYVIQAEHAAGAVYHAGDTCVWEGMRRRLSAWNIAAAILPINGRDAERFAAGVLGCMVYQEAGDLAGAIGARVALPGHFDAFARDDVDPEIFAAYVASRYPATRIIVPERGARLDIAG